MRRRMILAYGALILLGLALGAIINGFLAPLKINHMWQVSDIDPEAAVTPEGPFVGLALSGGGARAAVFAAAGMRALHARGLLDEVTHVSSVSGGGFAASYLATHPLGDCADDTCRAAYFDPMLDVMAHDYFVALELRQLLLPWRALSPSRRIESLREGLNAERFLDGTTFSDITDGRAYFFNAVSFDTGRRFVFSNAALPHPADAGADLILPEPLRALSFSDADTGRPAPGDLPIALAVATSAAFPPYLGPTTLEWQDDSGAALEFWHLGDGGIFENSGVETLREVALGDPDRAPARIYAFNAGLRLDHDLSRNTHDISIWSRDPARLVDVLLEYADAQRRALADELDARGGFDIQVVTFDYFDVHTIVSAPDAAPAPMWTDWEMWEGVCAVSDRGDSATPALHLRAVPTALRISDCNRALMEAAADFLVDYHLL